MTLNCDVGIDIVIRTFGRSGGGTFCCAPHTTIISQKPKNNAAAAAAVLSRDRERKRRFLHRGEFRDELRRNVRQMRKNLLCSFPHARFVVVHVVLLAERFYQGVHLDIFCGTDHGWGGEGYSCHGRRRDEEKQRNVNAPTNHPKANTAVTTAKISTLLYWGGTRVADGGGTRRNKGHVNAPILARIIRK